jgi:hypothetical protein
VIWFEIDDCVFCRLKRDAEWETRVPVADTTWKQIAEPVMQLYTETTDGSTIEDKETSLVWCYEDADPDFGSCQAKELLDHLESVLANEPVTVKSGQNIVEVKPQVRIIYPCVLLYILLFFCSLNLNLVGLHLSMVSSQLNLKRNLVEILWGDRFHSNWTS